MKEDKALAATVCSHAYSVFARLSGHMSLARQCVNCDKPVKHNHGFERMHTKFSIDPYPCWYFSVDLYHACEDPKCEAVGRRARERTSSFEDWRVCEACDKLEVPGQQFLTCSRCKLACYCCEVCQRSNRKNISQFARRPRGCESDSLSNPVCRLELVLDVAGLVCLRVHSIKLDD